MSTRSRIGLKDLDQVRSIYCHWDGYPTGNGKLLLEHWSDEAKLEKLLELGDISSLGEVIGRRHDFDARTEATTKMCTAYGRDRGETDCGADWHGIDSWPDCGQEWEYLFVPGDKPCTGHVDPDDGLLKHDGDTCPVHEGGQGWLFREAWDATSYEWAPLTAEFIEAEAAKEAAYLASQGITA